MAHIGARKILNHAHQVGRGVPCLLAGNLEMTLGGLMAAEEMAAPLILAYNAAVTPQMPMNLMIPLMARAAEHSPAQVATILDHGADRAAIARAIDLGLSTVMFDGSLLPFAENVRQTREIVQLAHAAGVDVEGELGAIGGSAIELGDGEANSEFTDPEMAARFVEQTGVDILAISFGNMHGIYGDAPHLDLERVQTIAGLVDRPLSMHGASGLAAAVYGHVIAAGISKVNYYTATARAVTHGLRQRLNAADGLHLVYHQVIDWTVEMFYSEAKAVLKMLGWQPLVCCCAPA